MALVEIEASRRMDQTAYGYSGVREWECLMSELTQTGSAGWTGSGITIVAKGDTWPFGSWTITPTCNSVQVIPHITRKKAKIVARYYAPSPWS